MRVQLGWAVAVHSVSLEGASAQTAVPDPALRMPNREVTEETNPSTSPTPALGSEVSNLDYGAIRPLVVRTHARSLARTRYHKICSNFKFYSFGVVSSTERDFESFIRLVRPRPSPGRGSAQRAGQLPWIF
jgi:hypothetical protein